MKDKADTESEKQGSPQPRGSGNKGSPRAQWRGGRPRADWTRPDRTGPDRTEPDQTGSDGAPVTAGPTAGGHAREVRGPRLLVWVILERQNQVKLNSMPWTSVAKATSKFPRLIRMAQPGRGGRRLEAGVVHGVAGVT